jgi:hypothetical protein
LPVLKRVDEAVKAERCCSVVREMISCHALFIGPSLAA